MNAHRILAVGLPNPVDIVTNVLTAPAGWAWDKVTEGITHWVLGAVAFFVGGVVNFLLSSARPNVQAAWFAGANSPYSTVRGIAVVLLLGFVLLGLIQGIFAGDVAAMLRRVAGDLPTAILGMVGTTVIVAKLLELTDALSSAVLSRSGDGAVHFLSGFGLTVTGATQGFAAVLLGLVAVLAGLLVWVELLVRSVLVYVLVAMSPLSFAAMTWPAARGVVRRTVELLLAVVLSKLVICIAISVGVAALAGAGTAGTGDIGLGDQAATSMGTLFVGTAVLAMAAFAPFLLLKMIPWVEAGLAAQGVSRSPVRAAHSTMGSVNYANSLARLAGSKTAPMLSAGSGSQTTGWISGAPLQGSADLGAMAGGPAGVAAAGAASAAKSVTGAATRAVSESVDTQATIDVPSRHLAPQARDATPNRSTHVRADAPKQLEDE